MIRLVDFNNYARRMLYAGRTIRQILSEAYDDEDLDQYWIADGFNCNARRRALFPDYKKNRQHEPGDSIFDALDFMKSNLKHTNAVFIEVPGYEADDVIAHLANAFSAEGERVHIDSNDLDLYALSALPGVTITRTSEVPPEDIRLYKTLVGDPSDNIPGLPSLGPKTFLKNNWTGLCESLKNLSETPNVSGLPDRIATAIQAEWESLKIYWQVVGFCEVPEEQIIDNLKVGILNHTLINYPE